MIQGAFGMRFPGFAAHIDYVECLAQCHALLAFQQLLEAKICGASEQKEVRYEVCCQAA